MERKFAFTEGQYYHIYNRGVEKRPIFMDNDDKKRFQYLLYLANGDRPIVFSRVRGLPLDSDRGASLTSIIAYSLMPNHFHILVREDKSGGVSRFMSKLATSYSMYFNTKHSRTGPLLHHPFRAKHINNDAYFRWVMSYVHLNAADMIEPGWEINGLSDVDRASQFIRSYPFASYTDYFSGERLERKILNPNVLPIDIADLESVSCMFAEFQSQAVRG